jgi:hypothetical protein
MPTKLSIFNEALRILGQPRMTTPDAETEHGRQLRDAWEGAVMACYEAGNFNHTIKRVELSRLDTTPAWGYQYYYELPTDFVRIAEITQSGMPNDPLVDYEIEDGGLAADADKVYVKYVSSELLILTPGEWSQSFSDFVAAKLAVRTAPKLASSNIELAMEHEKRYRLRSLSLDAIQNPPARRIPGRWASAARGARRNQEQGRW